MYVVFCDYFEIIFEAQFLDNKLELLVFRSTQKCTTIIVLCLWRSYSSFV